MFICGYNFCGGSMACALTPTAVENINYVELKNGMYDDLFITKDVEFEPEAKPPVDWDFNTVLYANFNSNTNAGNMDWNIGTVSDLVIKVRPIGKFKWKTIATVPINTIEDFYINYSDYMIPSGQPTQYAVVPVLNGMEGNYSITEITPKYNKMFIIEGDTVYGTEITDGFCDTTRNIPSSNVELPNRRYPIFVSNTIANYDTGTCSGSFVPVSEEDSCTLLFDSEHDYDRVKYQKEFMDFLCDRKPKILKMPDGRIWIIQITPSPQDTADAVYSNRNISFSWVEIGSTSEEDLYYLGLSTVSPEWWNN